MTFTYDASTTRVTPVDALGQRTNMTYDPGPHPPAANDDATGPILWVIDALGNRVGLTPPTSPEEPDGDDPIVVIKPS